MVQEEGEDDEGEYESTGDDMGDRNEVKEKF